MAILVDSYENKILDGLLGVAALTLPSEVFLALFTADPTETGDVTSELSGDGYNRVTLSGMFQGAVSGDSKNTAVITFPTASADWPQITHIGVMESGTPATSDMMMRMVLDVPTIVGVGKSFNFDIGALTLTAD